MTTKRMNRVDGEIQKALAKILSKLDDAEISSTIISILKVETFADFSMSKIYISVFGDENKKRTIVKKLNENQKTIRYNLAHSVRFRVVPELVFIADDLEQKSERILKLFEQIEGDSNNVK